MCNFLLQVLWSGTLHLAPSSIRRRLRQATTSRDAFPTDVRLRGDFLTEPRIDRMPATYLVDLFRRGA